MKTTIIIGGDICPTEDTKSFFDKEDTKSLFGDISLDFQKADLVFANLEFVLTDQPSPIKKNGPVLYGKTHYINIFKKAGINLLSLANNHIKDCGQQGVKETIETCEKAGIATFGAAKNLTEAKKPHITTFNNIKIGFLAFAEQEFNVAGKLEYGASYFDPYEDLDLIEKTKEEVDYLILIYHGGIEYYEYPSPELQKKCRKFIDKGADFVTCQHSHLIGTVENYKDKNILYGQGNTLFGYRKDNESWNQGLLIKIVFDNGNLQDIEFIPVTATENGSIAYLKDYQASKLLQKMMERSLRLKDSDFIEESWREFCKNRTYLYMPLLLGFNRWFIHLNRLTKGGLVKRLYGKRAFRTSHNIIRCEAHNEVIQEILKNSAKE